MSEGRERDSANDSIDRQCPAGSLGASELALGALGVGDRHQSAVPLVVVVGYLREVRHCVPLTIPASANH